jgi:hypothetical protein
MIEPIWYILYGGDSDDGRGDPTYYGRTTDKEVAKAHWKKCNSSPYSIGKVVAFTDTKKHTFHFDSDWEKLK